MKKKNAVIVRLYKMARIPLPPYTCGWDFINDNTGEREYSAPASIRLVLKDIALKLVGIRNNTYSDKTWAEERFFAYGILKNRVKQYRAKRIPRPDW